MHPKVSGFHLSKEIKQHDNERHYNERLQGIPVYIPPEVYSGIKYDKECDVYLLILYEIIAN